MSGADSDDDRADQLTERYRAASAADPARPGDSVRQSILAQARSVADAATRAAPTDRTRPPAANERSWRLATAASVLVAGFATLLAWHLHAPMPLPEPAPNLSGRLATAARNEPAAESTGPGQPSGPPPVDRNATGARGPNAVTTRSRERAVPPAPVLRPTRDAAADLQLQGTNVTSLQQGPASLAERAAAENSSAQVAPSAAAPPGAEARRSQAPRAAASAPASTAPASELLAAAESGDLERVDQLLRSGIGTEHSDARGRTALFVATLRGDVPMVRRLLTAGARADVVDQDGDTPLAAARRQGPPELARLLERATEP